jgi:5-methyltetrahydrofolate--homocysteine methyltransferase
MGTMLQREDVPADECGMLLNVLDPELIAGIHRQYCLAGAQALTTNSFGGTRAKLASYGLADRLEELNRAAVRLAKAAQPEHVLGDVGPCGLVLEPLGSAKFDEVFEQYAEQVRALAAEGPDAILIETMADIADARCALLAAKSVCDLPVIVSCTFDTTGHMELSGTTPETAAVILESAGAAAVGMNCGLGPEQLLPLLERMARATTLPLIIQPNAGLPQMDSNGTTYYTGTAEDFAEAAEAFRRAGAQFIGSCCGSTPAFTGAIYATVGDSDVVPRAPSAAFAGSTLLASPVAVVALGNGQPTRIIGERINPTGKPAFAAELEKGSLSLALGFGEEQEKAGASLIDVNVGAPMVDALVALPAVVRALQGFVTSPLVLDTTDYDALEAALRIYPGRALINSVNGDAASYERVFPLARTYGAAVIVLTLDETGIPATVEGRLAIAERVREQAHRFGLRDKDLVFDVLTMAAASDEDAPETTLAGVRALTERGLGTVLGVSNVSHGLPERPALNAAFVAAAIAAGLSAAIANPNDPVMSESVRLANARRDDASFDDALAQWREVYGQVMTRLNSSVSTGALGGAGTGAEGVRDTGAEAPDGTGQGQAAAAAPSPAGLLRQAILRGDRDATPALVDAVIAEGLEAAHVVDELLTPTLTELGEAFARGEAFLPQMMLAAGAMKVAVARIKEHLPETAADNIAGKVVFCTVKGDVHSIGKDICIALLESQGFKVFDLGVDVPIADVIETARAEDVDVICLSALMTTTLPNMKATVEEVYRALPGFAAGGRKALAVGGAVVTDRWAKSINALYSPDAPSCVRLIQSIVHGEH